MEIVKPLKGIDQDIKTVIFDFDGTISTLRQGWEEVMESLMLDEITGEKASAADIKTEIANYIEESTGIMTIYQMQWLEEKVREYGLNSQKKDKWEYKREYNKRLLKKVDSRRKKVRNGSCGAEEYLIQGSREFLQELNSLQLQLYLVSGTDHPDVLEEAELLGVKKYFTAIKGAPVKGMDSSKEKVLKHLLQEKNLNPGQMLIIGDGKVEISLAAEKGIPALGMATDEKDGQGIDKWKKDRLIEAGATAICGDFTDYRKIREGFNIR
ncbi:MAG: HAD family hydrolase [Halanaerobiales bacterium]